MAGGAATTTQYSSTGTASGNGKKFLFPFILVTSLFFMWGLAYGLLDVLNKQFQNALSIDKARSMLLQAAYFGAYFLMALPAGMLMKRFGYKVGIIFGLLLYALGAALFYPSAHYANFEFFLLALFVLASGLTFLETAANPYVTVLGDTATSERRLNLSQCFNGLGSFLGPLIGAQVFFHGNESATSSDLESVQMVYVVMAAVVLLIAFLFYRTSLPEIKEATSNESVSGKSTLKLSQQRHFVLAVVAQFFYVAAQVGIGALFINYVTEYWNGGASDKLASNLLSVSFGIFTLGRFVGTAIMRKVASNTLLAIFAVISIVLCGIVMMGAGVVSVIALMAIFFFMSIMFPTIFALGVKNLGPRTKEGSSFIIMSIVGGAIMPYVMGSIADSASTALAFVVPLICFVVVLFYGMKGYKTR